MVKKTTKSGKGKFDKKFGEWKKKQTKKEKPRLVAKKENSKKTYVKLQEIKKLRGSKFSVSDIVEKLKKIGGEKNKGKVEEVKKKIKIKKPKIPIPKFFKKDKGSETISNKKFIRRKQLKEYLNKAGIEIKSDEVIKKLFNIGIIINLILSALILFYFSKSFVKLKTVAYALVVLWVIIFVLILFSEWILLYIIIDYRIYKRKVEIEDVLSDYLQLTSSNIKAGMTIDKALWYAVRPRFGVLANEIEYVAKETMGGENLKDALSKFSKKYDSVVLQRAISMLIEGIDAGGEIGDLLNKIASNIQDQKIMVKEISASVTTYAIFITFAAIIAAPFMFALSGALIQVLQSLSADLGSNLAPAAGTLPISFSGVGIRLQDFRFFAVGSLFFTALFSSLIVASIKKGTIKSGIRYIPAFIGISMVLYFISLKVTEYLINIVF